MIRHPPLKDVVVLDFTRVLAGPYATMVLGDLGAEIIKIEPLEGDESRNWPPTLSGGESGYFMALNRNKKSITLNLKDYRAKQIAHGLAKKADIVVENFAPGVAERLGVDYPTFSKDHPELIYCSISGFGQIGPYRNKKAYDPIIQGMTGLMSITGEKDRPPSKVGIPITDLVAAVYAVSSIEAAYINRLKTDQGQYLDIALYDSMISLLTIMGMEYFVTGKSPDRMGLDHIHRVPARAFETKDGKYIQVAATSDVMYSKFCTAINMPELINDPRFCSNTIRLENRSEIMPLLESKMREKTLAEWSIIFDEASLPCGPIMDLSEVFSDDNISFRELVFFMEHPIEGKIPQLGFPYKFSATPAKARLQPPRLGEHTDDILKSWLGMNLKEITNLRESGTI
jgi:crotonobetainyl-CoA:carnitine CoA-transferase CaiB-like acyl-CoA transferase